MLLGPPGAGKGTQASILARELRVPHLSTGDLLRAAVAAETPLGREAEGHIRAGRLVPDELVLGIVRERLAEPDARDGFLLDGFPRTIAQADALDRLTPIDVVVYFQVPTARLIERLAGRRICPKCQSVYNVRSRPPKIADRCDRDGTELVQRPDDRPGAVATRLQVYEEQTAPLLEFYRRRGWLRSIDADGPPDAVTARLRAELGPTVASGSVATRSSSAPVHRSPSQ